MTYGSVERKLPHEIRERHKKGHFDLAASQPGTIVGWDHIRAKGKPSDLGVVLVDPQTFTIIRRRRTDPAVTAKVA